MVDPGMSLDWLFFSILYSHSVIIHLFESRISTFDILVGTLSLDISSISPLNKHVRDNKSLKSH